MSIDKVEDKMRVKRNESFAVLSEEMIRHVDEKGDDVGTQVD